MEKETLDFTNEYWKNKIHPKWEKTMNYCFQEEYKNKFIFTNDYPVPKVEELNNLDKNKKMKMMEIGTQEGRTSFHLLNTYLLHPESKMYCLDIWSDDMLRKPMEQNFDHNIKVSGFQNKIVKMKGPSWKTLRKLNNDSDFESFDFIYIDGWHGANGVIEDAIQCWKLLKVGGILSFDDYLWGWNVFKPQRKPQLAIDAFCFIFSPFFKEIKSNKKTFIKTISNDEEANHLIKFYQ